MVTSRSRTAPSSAFNHVSSFHMRFLSASLTMGEKNRIADRSRVSARRISCRPSASPLMVASRCAPSASRWRRAIIRNAVSQGIPAFSRVTRGRSPVLREDVARGAGFVGGFAAWNIWGDALVRFKCGYPAPARSQGLLRRSRSIDERPVDRADIILLLEPGDLGRRVRSVPRAPRDPGLPGLEIRDQKQSNKAVIRPVCDIADCGTFALARKYRIRNGRMALCKDVAGLLRQQVVDPLADLRPIRACWKPVLRADTEQPLAQDVAAQDHRARS